MSTDESSLLSVGSARNKWEQMTSESTTPGESKQAPPPVRKRPKSFLSTAPASSVPSQPDTTSSSSKSLLNPNILHSTSPPSQLGLGITHASSQQHLKPDFDTSKQASVQEHTSKSNGTSSTAPSTARPKPAIGKKPAHLSGVPIDKLSQATVDNKPTLNSDPSSVSTDIHVHQSITLPLKSTVSPPPIIIQTDVRTLDTTLAQTTISDRNVIARSEVTPSLIVPPSNVVVSRPESSNQDASTALGFVPPPFRQLSPGIGHHSETVTPPPPPASRPVTPVVPSVPKFPVSPASSTFVPPKTPDAIAFDSNKSPGFNNAFVPPKSSTVNAFVPPKSPSLNTFVPPKSPALNTFVPPTISPNPVSKSPITFIPPTIPTSVQSVAPILPPRAASITQISSSPSQPQLALPTPNPPPSIIHATTVQVVQPTPTKLPDPSVFMPPPPLPRHNTIPQTQHKPPNERSTTQVPVPTTSPAPPPPPSRKLNQSLSQTNLNGSTTSPLPSPTEHSQTVHGAPHIYQPQPRQPFDPALVLTQGSNLPQSIPTASPSPSGPNPTTTNVLQIPPPSQPVSVYQPPPPPQRLDYFNYASQTSRSSISTQDTLVSGRKQSVPHSIDYSSEAEEDGYEDESAGKDGIPADYITYPDSSQANRRAPIFGGPLHEISTKHRVEAIGVYGTTLIVSSNATKVIELLTGEIKWTFSHSDVKVSAIGFKPSADPKMRGQIAWLGTREGHLWEVDVGGQAILHKRLNAHMTAIVAIEAVGKNTWTISEDGKICVWENYINDTPKAYRMTPNFKALCFADDTIWCGRNRQVHVYHPTPSGEEQFNITSRPIACFPLAVGRIGGEFTCAAYIKRFPDSIFFGHEDGTITMFSRSKGIAVESINVSMQKICSMTGVGTHLWIGLKTGHIYVVDVSVKPWRIMKEWKAHESSVRDIASNYTSFYTAQQFGHLPVISVGPESGALLWDGLLKTDWIGKYLLLLLLSTNII